MALSIWSNVSMLTFIEAKDNEYADIIISFEPEDHSFIDEYKLSDGILAHAFPPSSGIGGDVHFRENIEWDFDVMFGKEAPYGKRSFFAVALHELGHAIGLDHSQSTDAVMYAYFHEGTGVLSQDDIDGIQYVYGIPDKLRSTTKRPFIYPEDSSKYSPNKCNTSFDAVLNIQGVQHFFKDIYVWRTDQKESFDIRGIWKELPKDITHIDAVHEGFDGNLWFFIGQDIYAFKKRDLAYKTTLSKIGIDSKIKKIDAIFRWHYNKRLYIFSGDYYWRLKSNGETVDTGYPQGIPRIFHDVYDIDTAFDDGTALFFMIGDKYFAFDDEKMRMDRMKPESIGVNFLNCFEPINRVDLDNPDRPVIRDFTPDPVLDDTNNPEKMPVAPEKEDEGGNKNDKVDKDDKGSANAAIVTIWMIALMQVFCFLSEDWNEMTI